MFVKLPVLEPTLPPMLPILLSLVTHTNDPTSITLYVISCSLHSDYCTVEGQVRLVGGSSLTEGRVEICSGGVWSTVCDSQWGTADAQVVCRQLEFLYDGAVARTSAYFGQGTGPIQLSNLQCTGNEDFLQNCTYSSTNTCTHGNDAGVTCPGETILNAYPKTS